jgi:hypothetical protein
VRSRQEQAPDWRNAAAYAPLLAAERSIFVWEWLRRDASYRKAAQEALPRTGGRSPAMFDHQPAAAAWSLHAFEDPDIAAPAARPVWHAPALLADAEPCEGKDAFVLERVADCATLVQGREGQHLLLTDGLRGIRLDIVRGSILEGPVRLRYRLSGLRAAEAPLLALRQLLALWRTGRFWRELHRAATRADRLVLMLRASDALASGATQREIAHALLSREAAEPRWRAAAPTLRSRAQRLVRAARAMAAGGYASLLGS